jgi:hypothetical protein
MPRSDSGKKRENYKTNDDNTGKTGKENKVIRAFWKKNRVKDVMLLSSTELDKIIDEWLGEYQQMQLKKDKSWWYPSIGGKTLNEVRNKRTNIDKGWHL